MYACMHAVAGNKRYGLIKYAASIELSVGHLSWIIKQQQQRPLSRLTHTIGGESARGDGALARAIAIRHRL